MVRVKHAGAPPSTAHWFGYPCPTRPLPLSSPLKVLEVRPMGPADKAALMDGVMASYGKVRRKGGVGASSWSLALF